MGAADKTTVQRGPKLLMSKTRKIARTMTTGTQVATLPRGSRIVGFLLNGVASDAGTTATISVGSTATANEYVNAYDVKTAANGTGTTLLPAVSGAIGGSANPPTSAALPIFVIYAETGAASANGNWYLTILYTEGNDIFDETV